MNSITFLITQSLIKWLANWSYEYDVVTALVLFFYLRRRRLLTKRSFLYFSIARNIWTNFGVNVSPTFHISINNPLWRRVDMLYQNRMHFSVFPGQNYECLHVQSENKSPYCLNRTHRPFAWHHLWLCTSKKKTISIS